MKDHQPGEIQFYFVVGKKASPKKRRQTAEEKKKELEILGEKLNLLQDNILPPSTSTSHHLDVFISDSETSESDGELPNNLGDLRVPAPQLTSTPNGRAQHPRFGGKCPKKQPQPFPRCINVRCKEEKALQDEKRHCKMRKCICLRPALSSWKENYVSPTISVIIAICALVIPTIASV